MRKFLIGILFITFFFAGCSRAPEPQKTQLQIREFQTRTFQVKDQKLVLKAMLNVLQDDGYIVKNVVSDMGLLSAVKEADVESKGEAFAAAFFGGQNARWKKAQIIEATCNVSEHADTCKVRASFVMKVLDNKGGIIDLKQVDDQNYYQDFFSKVDKSIFLQKQGL
jgi:PBP1b-binding outer membrane lipoprotein LpoB